MLHPQKFIAACSQQIVFVLACRLAEVLVTFALCMHTILNSCVGLCALLNVVVPNCLAAVQMDLIGEH